MAAGALALGLATLVTPSQAQGPLYDTVYVNLPYSVTLGNKTLQPGNYVIRELPQASKSYVLEIYADNGMKWETSAMTIPAYKVDTPDSTTVVLHHFGPDYYFDRIWIQGKNYGYEFPLPNSVKERQKELQQPISVAARYEATPAPATTAQNTTPPAAQNQTTPPANETTPPAATAQNTTPQAAPAPTTPAPSTPPATAQNTVPQQRTLPTTSADWLMMLLSGGGLSGAGLFLRRKRS